MTYEKKVPTKQGFYSWFQEKKDPYLVAQYQYLFFEIDKYCNRSKAIGAGLFDVLSQDRVLQIQKVMENDTWYWIFHKKQVKEVRKAFQYILQYLQELDAENAKIVSNSTAVDKGDSVDASEENESASPSELDVNNSVITKETGSIPAINYIEAKGDSVVDEKKSTQENLPIDHSAGDSAPTSTLSKQIEAILREECEKNPYGTTVSFIKGKIPGAQGTDIKNILLSASWAKSEMGAWKYVFPIITSDDQDNHSVDSIRESSVSEEINGETDFQNQYPLVYKRLHSTNLKERTDKASSYCVNELDTEDLTSVDVTKAIQLDFENLPPLAFSKPLKLVYRGDELIGACSWKNLYVHFFEALYKDYPHQFLPGMRFTLTKSGPIDLGNQDMNNSMRSPKLLKIEGQTLFLETNVSADHIAQRIKNLLDLCNVDYKNVEILYTFLPNAILAESTKESIKHVPLTINSEKETKEVPQVAQSVEPKKTKFARTSVDAAVMKADPAAFRSVYYVLKERSRTNSNGVTATDIYLALGGKIRRKQIIEILSKASWSKKGNDYSYLFYDEQREEKKQQQIAEKAQNVEQEFFTWLPSAVPPSHISNLKRNTPAIDAVLQQKKFLPQPLFLTTKICNVEAAEVQARKKLSSQKQRDLASELLRAYAAFLREKKNTAGKEHADMVEPQEGWIHFDFTNAERFSGTVPVYCSLDGKIIEEKNWARVLVAISNLEIAKNNPALQSLYKHALIPNRNDRPFFLLKAIPGQNCAQLSNGYWINLNFIIPLLMEQIQALCLHCGYSKRQVTFYGIPRQMRSPKETASERKAAVSEQSSLPPEAPTYSEILSEKFVRGFRIGSGLDMKKFKRYYEEKTGNAVEKTDAQIEAIISHCGIRYDEKVFLPAAMLPEDLRDKLFDYIRSSLSSGKTALYYEAIFREFSERFLDHYIYSADMLKSYIAFYNNGEFYMDSKYVSREAAVEVNPFDDVKEYLLAAGGPVESEQICQDLSHIPQRTVMQILGSNAEFVNNGVLVANGTNSYFFIDVVELSDEDIDNIAALIQDGIEEREFLSGNELIEAIRARYPHILERNSRLSSLGMRDAIKYHLKDRFSFTGNVISKLNQAISMADVFSKYAKDHPEFTVSELTTLAEEMKSGVYFDDVYAHALRIDAKCFVSKEQVHFHIAETDSAIENSCADDYFPLKAIHTFSFFPEAGYPWNTVLLESYGYSYSKKYRLLHVGFNRTSSVGALVKRSAGIDSFDALLARALADSKEKLDKDAALAFFVKQGYLARRNYSNIEAVLLEAKTIRNKKG